MADYHREHTDTERASSLKVTYTHEGIWLHTWADGLGARAFLLSQEEARLLADGLRTCADPLPHKRKITDDPRA